MKNQILTFTTLEDMVLFSKNLDGGYLLNTATLTLTAKITDDEIARIMSLYRGDTSKASQN